MQQPKTIEEAERRHSRLIFAMQCLAERTDDDGARDFLIAAGVGEKPNHDLLSPEPEIYRAAMYHEHDWLDGSCAHCGLPQVMHRADS